MSKYNAMLRTLALCALLSISHVAQAQFEACLTVYADYSIDGEEQEIAAWSLVEDYVDSGWCAEQVGFWGFFSHSYSASVSISSPTQNSASNVGNQFNIPYGGGSAQSFALLPYENDYGVFVIESIMDIICSIAGHILNDIIPFLVEIPAPPGLVHVEYALFIPLSHVRLPPPFGGFDGTIFLGDNQPTYIHGSMFPYNSTYRIRQQFYVNTLTRTVQGHDRLSGITLEYSPASQFLSTSTSCYRKFCPTCPTYLGGQSIVHSGYCLVHQNPVSCIGEGDDMGSIVAVVDQLSSSPTSVVVQFQGAPSNSCQALAPAIDWQNTLTISWAGGENTYHLQMNHDGFPMHEVRINGQLVYDHDPVLTGHTPLDLAPWQGNVTPPPLSGPLP